jgi:hypothetical protein
MSRFLASLLRRRLPLVLALGGPLLWASCTDVASDAVGPPDAAFSQAPASQDIQAAIAALNRNSDRLMALPGVVGVGVGLRAEGGPVVRVFTASRGVGGLPDGIEGFPVEIEVTGLFFARNTTARYRPAPIGVSVGHPNITAGTIGARVVDASGNVYALSNNHVLANSNDASIGDGALQPGPYDGGSDPGDRIGTLHAFEPIRFDGSDNIMDAAIARSSTGELGNATLPNGYGVPGTTPVNASVGAGVQKYGRTTELTKGEVSEVNVTVTVCYAGFAIFCTKSARFVGQVTVTPGSFSSGGDSGSLIVTDDGSKNPVALLFAGSSTRTIGSPIGPILTRFNVSIDGAESSEPDPDPEPEPEPEPGVIALSVSGFKERGLQKADLSWNVTASSVEIYRNNVLITTVPDTGAYRDDINERGGGSYTYRVCQAGTSTCSNEATVTF